MKWSSPFQMASELPNIHVQKLTVSGNATHFTQLCLLYLGDGDQKSFTASTLPTELAPQPNLLF